MPGIYGMAILTIAVTALLCITTLNQLTQSDHRYLWLTLAGLPLSFVVNRFIKIPAITLLAAWTGNPLKLGPDMPVWFLGVLWLNAPLFEEAIKMLPLVLPVRRLFLQGTLPALWAGLALGMGFGLGEAIYLAYGIGQAPSYNPLPWYLFTGFAFERLIVTFAHGLMTSVAVAGLPYGKRGALFGYFLAVGLHALINIGPILFGLKLISATVSSLCSYAAILAAFVIFQNTLRRAKRSSGIAQREIVYL